MPTRVPAPDTRAVETRSSRRYRIGRYREAPDTKDEIYDQKLGGVDPIETRKREVWLLNSPSTNKGLAFIWAKRSQLELGHRAKARLPLAADIWGR